MTEDYASDGESREEERLCPAAVRAQHARALARDQGTLDDIVKSDEHLRRLALAASRNEERATVDPVAPRVVDLRNLTALRRLDGERHVRLRRLPRLPSDCVGAGLAAQPRRRDALPRVG